MLITQYAAAKEAGVTRQAINKLKNKTPRPLFFIELKEGFKIDNDSQLWKSYIEQLKIKRGNIGAEQKRFNALLSAVVSVIKEKFDPEPEEMEEILTIISNRSGLGG